MNSTISTFARTLGSTLRALVVAAWCAPLVASAQHPIEVERAAAKGEYLQALVAFDTMPKRKETTDSLIAAGKSAWALGLAPRAIEEFDTALQDETLDPIVRARLLLSHGIIDFQEGRAQVALIFAERAAALLRTPSALRAQIWLLWGDSLSSLHSYGEAEEKYKLALGEAAAEERGEINFRLGECRLKLGKLDEARASFEGIPLSHERTGMAVRRLAEIALEAGHFKHAEFWLTKGRAEFPDQFLDSWVDFALLKVAASENDVNKIEEIRRDALRRYPPSDHWFTLLDAAAESEVWRARMRDLMPPTKMSENH